MLPVFVVSCGLDGEMKHANAARMTQVGQLDAEVPALPDRFVPHLFVITGRTDNTACNNSNSSTET